MKKLKRLIIAGAISIVILSIVCSFYYLIPVHKKNNNGSTDYVWEEKSLYIRTDEGIGFGKTNNEGYMNLNDFDGNIDVLLMGSSHMEDQNIPLTKNASSLLNKLIPNLETYNIGVSGHSFKVIVNNLDAALKKYKPKYVILEASNLLFSDEYIEKILAGDVDEIESNSNKIIEILEKNAFLRIFYTQVEKFINGDDFAIDEANIESVDFDLNEELNDKLLKYIKNVADKYDAKVIIMYHPSIAINKDGKIVINTKEISAAYSRLCETNNIYFLDMTDRFILEYEQNYTIPKGFINGPIATGHLNVDGHRMIAEELHKLIVEINK